MEISSNVPVEIHFIDYGGRRKSIVNRPGSSSHFHTTLTGYAGTSGSAYDETSGYMDPQEPKPCWLLRLSTEILLKILHECTKPSQARMARTTKALHQISSIALFRSVRLPEYDFGESFRLACRSNPQRRNEMRFLKLPASIGWCDWFRWDSSMRKIPSLQHLYATNHEDFDPFDTEGCLGLGATLQLATEIAPNISRLGMYKSPVIDGLDAFSGGLAKLRRLDLDQCEMDGPTLKELSRSLRALTSISIVTQSNALLTVSETWLEGLSSFPNLTTLRLTGWLEFQPLETNLNRIFEFPSLESLFLGTPTENWDSLGVLERVHLPKVRRLDFNITTTTVLEELGAALVSRHMPQLSLLKIFYEDVYLRSISVTPLFIPLQSHGFEFDLHNKLDSENRRHSWWVAKRTMST